MYFLNTFKRMSFYERSLEVVIDPVCESYADKMHTVISYLIRFDLVVDRRWT